MNEINTKEIKDIDSCKEISKQRETIKLEEKRINKLCGEEIHRDVQSDIKEVDKKISCFESKNFEEKDSFNSSTEKLKERCAVNHKLSEVGGEEMVSKEQIEDLKKLRETVSPPDENTVMQKVICKEDLKYYLNPPSKSVGMIGGFVSKAADTAPFCKTGKEMYENLRLDYQNNPFNEGNSVMYIVRFKTDTKNIDKFKIPYSQNFSEAGYDYNKPFAGSGFTGAKDKLIPEYLIANDVNGKPTRILPSDGMIFCLDKNDQGEWEEKPYAYYDKDEKCFQLFKKEVTQ